MNLKTENEKKIRFCKICNVNENDTRFQVSRKTCIKCNSRKCNEKLGNEYFRLKMIGRYNKTYERAGRPRKEIVVEKIL